MASAQELPISLPEDLMPELREILVRAANNAPAVQVANIERARLEGSYITSRSILLPAVSGSASYTWSESEIEDAPLSSSKSDGLYYSFGASQPIFHWGALKAQTDIAKLEVLIGEQNWAEAYRALAVSLRDQYLGLVLKKIALRNQQFAQKIQEEDLSLQEERLRTGVISTGDILGPRLATEESRYYTARYEQDFEAAVRVFAQLSGDPTFTAARVPDVMPRPEYANEVVGDYLRQLSSEAIRDLPHAQVYALRVEQEDKRYKIERTRLLPKIGASASYGVSNLTSASPTLIQQTAVVTSSVAISAHWALFDGFASRGGRMAALASKRLNERYLDTILETTMNQLRALQKDIELSGRMLDITERRFDLSREAVRLTRKNFEAGVAPQSQVDRVTNNSNEAEMRASTARSNLLSNWAHYISLAGADPVVQQAKPSAERLRR